MLDLARVLLLVQAAVLVAGAVEAAFFAVAFGGASGPSVPLTAAAALALLAGRARLSPEGTGGRRVVYALEIALLATVAANTALALLVARSGLPPMAVVAQFLLPVAVIATVHRVGRRSVSVEVAG